MRALCASGVLLAMLAGLSPAQASDEPTLPTIEVRSTRDARCVDAEGARDYDCLSQRMTPAEDASARPVPQLGSEEIAVEDALKVQSSAARNEQSTDTFVHPCQPSAILSNVGFRPGGKVVCMCAAAKSFGPLRPIICVGDYSLSRETGQAIAVTARGS